MHSSLHTTNIICRYYWDKDSPEGNTEESMRKQEELTSLINKLKKNLIVTEDKLNMLELIAFHWNKSHLFNLKQKRRTTTRKTTL